MASNISCANPPSRRKLEWNQRPQNLGAGCSTIRSKFEVLTICEANVSTSAQMMAEALL